MKTLLALSLAFSFAAALPASAYSHEPRGFGLTPAHEPKAHQGLGLGGGHGFKPFHGLHTSSRRGGLDGYPHAKKPKFSTDG
jgi:hypothetical protein